MIPIVIKINGKSDPPCFTELQGKCGPDVEFYGVAILEAGMASGKTSLTFLVKDADGKYHLAQTSKAIFESILAAANGAEQRWAELKQAEGN